MTHLGMHAQSSAMRRALKALTICLYLTTSIAFGKKPMEAIYDLRETTSLKPDVYKVTEADPIHLFTVPQDNAVGTNDLDNAITLLTFQKKGFKAKNYFVNALPYMSGGGQYLPTPISDHSIGIAQARRFVIYDFKSGEAEDYTIAGSIQKDILEAGIADATAKRFLFEIEGQNPKSQDYNDVIQYLVLMDMNEVKDGRPRIVKKMDTGTSVVWSTFKNQLFFCDFSKDVSELTVFDSNLNPSHHPVEGALKKNKGKVDYLVIVPHPTLPFAITYGGTQGAQYLCWNQTFRSEEARVMFTVFDAAYFRFSPDGRWVIFQKTDPEPKYSYIMPISEKYPNYIGSPILLEGATFDRDHFAWTNNPVSLVGSAREKLYRYDLTKEAHPEAASYPSYWDYVVEKDLEKLRKAGKQGLKPKP